MEDSNYCKKVKAVPSRSNFCATVHNRCPLHSAWNLDVCLTMTLISIRFERVLWSCEREHRWLIGRMMGLGRQAG